MPVQILRPFLQGTLMELGYIRPREENWKMVNELHWQNDGDDSTVTPSVEDVLQQELYVPDYYYPGQDYPIEVVIIDVVGRRLIPETNTDTAKIILKTHDTIYKSAEMGWINPWADCSWELTTNPSTGLAWTWAEIEDLQVGFETLNKSNEVGYVYFTAITLTISHQYEANATFTVAVQGNGSLLQCEQTPGSGEAHYEDVNDTVQETYIYDGTLDNPTDLFVFFDFLASQFESLQWYNKEISKVVFTANNRLGGEQNNFKWALKYDGSTIKSSAIYPTEQQIANYVDYLIEYELNPFTNQPWTWADLNPAIFEVGVELNGTGEANTSCTRISVTIHYIYNESSSLGILLKANGDVNDMIANQFIAGDNFNGVDEEVANDDVDYVNADGSGI